MYSKKIEEKVNVMFSELRKKTSSIVNKSSSPSNAIDMITQLASSELSSRSKSILSDMLFELSDEAMRSEFFSDIGSQNRFYEVNIRQEILNKYHFSTKEEIKYSDESNSANAFKAGASTFAIGSVAVLGYVLVKELSVSSLVPISVCALIALSIGVALTDYYAIEPKRNKKSLEEALDKYLSESQVQFMDWFDEVEKYFNTRVEEIKNEM